MSLALVRRHIALAGLVGLTLALILTPASHVLGVGGVIYTVVALVSNKINEDLKPKGYNIVLAKAPPQSKYDYILRLTRKH